LLDPTHARLELADEHAMTDDGGVVFDHGPPEPDDLIGELLAHGQHVRSYLNDFGTQVGDLRPYRFQVSLGCELGAHLGQKLEYEAGGLFRHWSILAASPIGVRGILDALRLPDQG